MVQSLGFYSNKSRCLRAQAEPSDAGESDPRLWLASIEAVANAQKR